MSLDLPLEAIKGLAPAKIDLLKRELSIFSVEQLLEHYPLRHIDRSRFYAISEITPSMEQDYVQIRGILRRIDTIGEGRKKRMVGLLRDAQGHALEIVWFHALSWVGRLEVNVEYIVFGRPNFFNGQINMVHPEMELAQKEHNLQLQDPNHNPPSLQPIYSSTEKLRKKGLDTKGLSKIIRQALELAQNIAKTTSLEYLPQTLCQELKLVSRLQAIYFAHFPPDSHSLRQAQRRIKFEEFFLLQFRLLYGKYQSKLRILGLPFPKLGPVFHQFYEQGLSFELTQAQKRVLREIRRDLGSGAQMNRLLQGDVGSGKTIVAFMTSLMALDNGFQTALMAPTEILAQQHFQSLEPLAQSLGITIALLTGNVKGKIRKNCLQALAQGQIKLLIGTHALIEDKVQFENLGLVIIDEQHRFGVEQRAKMWHKNPLAPPHVLVMTATPIPRTLAMTVYGDLDVSIIDELPPGRQPIQTFHKFESARLWTFGLIRKQIQQGRQAYIVYPLIEESESQALEDIKNLYEGFEAIQREFPPPQYQISIVHGRQKPEDKAFEMQRFAQGQTQIMVATTVIEVGVNVPNATLMVIENAERFGLAQLHQLRGRVGRGGGESFCILMTDFKLSKEGRFRMDIMTQTTDGFKIAEADLKLRGPGSLQGTRQSGLEPFKMADIVQDAAILRVARESVQQILEQDPNLEQIEHNPLKHYLNQTAKGKGYDKIS